MNKRNLFICCLVFILIFSGCTSEKTYCIRNKETNEDIKIEFRSTDEWSCEVEDDIFYMYKNGVQVVEARGFSSDNFLEYSKYVEDNGMPNVMNETIKNGNAYSICYGDNNKYAYLVHLHIPNSISYSDCMVMMLCNGDYTTVNDAYDRIRFILDK